MSNNDSTDKADSRPGSRRRRILNWLAGIGIASFVIGLITPLKDLALAVETQAKGEPTPQLPGQRLVFAHTHKQNPGGHEHAKGTVVTVDKLTAPDDALVAPEKLTDENKFLINLHRLEPEKIEEPTKKEWTDQGFVAYSAICTHLGCTVNWEPDAGDVGFPHDLCPCHVGEYDPYKGAEVVGGPPPRPTPQIGVEVNDENELVLTSKFEGPIGSE
ncbi:MAG TPA: ubiquinol-cytochrome c reductase iron-sulfur subunit [bacterium]|nr:ubiquinol-cytochrome c reductase iron-sulfur subunit [bacterium]